MNTKEKNKTLWKLKYSAMVQLAVMAINWGYFGIWMKNHGLGESSIGLVFAVNALLTGVSSLLWAHLSEKFGKPHLLVITGNILLLVFFVVLPSTTTITGLMLLGIIAAFGISAFQSIMPVMTLSLFKDANAGREYGVYRVYGSIGYLLGNFILGSIAFKFGLPIVFYLCAAIISISIFLLLNLNTPLEHNKKNWRAFFPLIKNVSFLLLLISIFFKTITDPVNFSFLALYAKTLNANDMEIGWILGMGGIVAIIALPTCGAIADKFGARYIVLLALISQPLRALAYSWVTENYWYLYLPQLFHFFTFAGLEVGLVIFVGELLGKENRQLGFSIVVLVQTFALTIGNNVIGNMVENVGYIPMFTFASKITTLSLPFFALLLYRIRKT